MTEHLENEYRLVVEPTFDIDSAVRGKQYARDLFERRAGKDPRPNMCPAIGNAALAISLCTPQAMKDYIQSRRTPKPETSRSTF